MAVTQSNVPKPRIAESAINIKPPKTRKIIVTLIKGFLPIDFSSTPINLETNTELKNKATINEDPKTTERVIGKIIINEPTTPGQKPKGKKAATVVKVEMIMGNAISPTPCFAA